jgi:hypothetical protein
VSTTQLIRTLSVDIIPEPECLLLYAGVAVKQEIWVIWRYMPRPAFQTCQRSFDRRNYKLVDDNNWVAMIVHEQFAGIVERKAT